MSTSAHPIEHPVVTRKRVRPPHPGQQAAASAGAVFLLIGLLGFIPGITSGLDSLAVVGPDSGAMLLGAFQVSILLNLVHLGSGVLGLWMARTLRGARRYLLGGGAVYLLMWLYGTFIGLRGGGNFMQVNDAGNWLNLVFGAAMMVLGVLTVRAFGRSRS